jgi:hypothetical protein
MLYIDYLTQDLLHGFKLYEIKGGVKNVVYVQQPCFTTSKQAEETAVRKIESLKSSTKTESSVTIDYVVIQLLNNPDYKENARELLSNLLRKDQDLFKSWQDWFDGYEV